MDFELFVECLTDLAGVHENPPADLVVGQESFGLPIIENSEGRSCCRVGKHDFQTGLHSNQDWFDAL